MEKSASSLALTSVSPKSQSPRSRLWACLKMSGLQPARKVAGRDDVPAQACNPNCRGGYLPALEGSQH